MNEDPAERTAKPPGSVGVIVGSIFAQDQPKPSVGQREVPNAVIATLPIAGALLAGAGGAFALDRLALAMVRPPVRPFERTPEDLPFRYEDVGFTSSGEQRLRGWILHPERDGGKAAVVVVHGWGSNSGNVLRLAAPLVRSGHPVLAFDVRHHGRSALAPYVTVRHYRDDVAAAARFLRTRFPDRPRFVVGHSMGGATAVLAAAEGAPVEGVALVASPAELFEIWAGYLDDRGMPGSLVVRICFPFWRWRVGVPFNRLVPETRISELELPVLVVHGSDDRRVPPEHGRRLARGAGVDPVVVDGAGHSDVLDDPRLHRTLEMFLENSLRKMEAATPRESLS